MNSLRTTFTRTTAFVAALAALSGCAGGDDLAAGPQDINTLTTLTAGGIATPTATPLARRAPAGSLLAIAQHRAATPAPAVPERVIVKVHNYAKARSAVVAAGGSVALELRNHGAFAAYIPAAAVNALTANVHIDYIEADAKRYPMSQTTPYGIGMVQADQISDLGAGNRTVCIIDSGYALGHEDLPGVGVVTGSDDIGGAGPWATEDGVHGTHVAGTIAALSNGVGVVGVLPSGTVKLHIVRVFNDSGWAYSSSLIGALDKCEAAGANVVNMSLGGSFKSKFEDDGFKAAYGRGVLSIAAAGNDGNTRKSYPASYNSVVSVAAVDSNGNIASFSQQNAAVEIAAPGVYVNSTVPTGKGLAATTTVNGVAYAADTMEDSPVATATGTLVDCGIGNVTCPGGGGQVCLIARGTISFSDKVLACQNGGGVAAIITNNEPGALLGTMGGVATTIPSIGVSQADGATMAGQLGTSATVAISATNYAHFDGTSMATPHVVGVAALVWSQNPAWTNDQIRSALQATAVDLGVAGKDAAYGYGLIQAKAALDYLNAVPPVCTPTEANETSCTDGVDNDCDGKIDAADSDCNTGGTCTLLPAGSSCTSGSACCSGNCKGKPGNQTCK